MERIWLKHYPADVPSDIDCARYPSLVALIEDSFKKYRDRPAYKFMGRTLTFGEVDDLSREMAAWLQAQPGLSRGDRVALMLPNVPQYPVAIAAVLRAGFVVVNVNPLYTPRELEHQLKDAGAKAIFILDKFAGTLQQIIRSVPTRHVVVCSMGDLLGFPKGLVVDMVMRHVKKMIPPFDLPQAVRFKEALAAGRRKSFTPANVGPDDMALLQYTGGTTGVSKGAVLLHRNLVANVLQCEAWFQPVLKKIIAVEQVYKVCALPLYHVFGLNTNLLLGICVGACNILIPNPRDCPAVLKELSKHRFHVFPAVNTLLKALATQPDIGKVNWSSLKITIGGGMSVHQATAKLWLEKTGCPVCEGYGLSETSPVVACNPVDSKAYSGTIGLPLSNTEIKLLDDDGNEVPPGTAGELAVKGPQVMAGYWQRPDETAHVMTADGYFRTGDIAMVDERGYFRIVDRKKDMIVVSGFKVFPNEIEDVLTQLDGVLECAAIGISDDKAGEVVKLVIVKKNPALTENHVRAYCETNLAGYKRPRVIEFRAELPKTPIGKILRRELRDPK